MIDVQCIVWNTWGPIETGAQYAFDWSESTVAMFANWGTIMFLLAVVPLSKMVEVTESVRNPSEGGGGGTRPKSVNFFGTLISSAKGRAPPNLLTKLA